MRTIIKRLSPKSKKRCWITDCPNKATVKVPDDSMDIDICEAHFRKDALTRVDEHRFDTRSLFAR